MRMENQASAPRVPAMCALAMALVVLSALMLIDWTNTGVSRPLWMLFLPSAFGIAGIVFALRKNALGWALAAGVLGFAAFPTLYYMVLVVSGP